MALKYYKPTTSSQRHTVIVSRKGLSKLRSVKKLTVGKKSMAGRNNQGRITVRHRGGGVKRNYRIVDFKRNKYNIVGKIEAIEYDPNRTSNIARVIYTDGERRYIIAFEGATIGDMIVSGEEVEIKIGNAMPLKRVPNNTLVHNVELLPGAGGKLAKSAGSFVVVRGSTGAGYIILKMASGEIRMVNENCYATIGTVSNSDHFNVRLGKAGRKRWLGRRPEVRGVAMHAEEHPHGGGEARNGIHMAKDIWGHRLGKKTRNNKKTERFIIKHRVSKRNAPGIA